MGFESWGRDGVGPGCSPKSSITLVGRATWLGLGEPKGEEAGEGRSGLELWLSFGSQTRGAVGKLAAEQQREVIRFVSGGEAPPSASSLVLKGLGSASQSHQAAE